jgi:hypothetical protein
MSVQPPWLLLGLLLSCALQAFAACNSFANKCDVQIGTVLKDSNGQPIQLASHQSYYLSFTVRYSICFSGLCPSDSYFFVL